MLFIDISLYLLSVLDVIVVVMVVETMGLPFDTFGVEMETYLLAPKE